MAEFGLSEDIYLEIINDCFYNEKTDVVGNDNDPVRCTSSLSVVVSLIL